MNERCFYTKENMEDDVKENMKEISKIGFIGVLFFLLYIILPSYFAVEISEILPLMTASRILLILLVISYMVYNKGIINTKVFYNTKLKNAWLVYFCLMIISNLYYILSTTAAIKQIFTLIFEELLVIWIITKIVTTKKDIITCLKIMSISSGIVAIISIISSITGKNLFYYLITVNRSTILTSNYYRMGFVRAEAGFGHAVYYGAYCVCMIPIIMYIIGIQKEKNIYIICLFLNIIALFFANSRGSLIIGILMFIYMSTRKKTKHKKEFMLVFAIFILILIVTCIISITIRNYIYNIFISIINVFYSNKYEIDNYGNNEYMGLKSRTSQITQMTFALSQNPLFGLGADAHNRGVLKWYNPWAEKWQIIKTIDVGYIGIIVQYGVVGGIAFFILILTLIKSIFNQRNRSDDLIQMFKFVFVSYFLMMLSVSGLHDFFWVIFGLYIAYTNILEEKGRVSFNTLDLKNML